MNKIILWDFDGTLGYREGNWEEVILELTEEKIIRTKESFDLVSKMLQEGFPWHEPQKSFIEITDSLDWWDYVNPRFIQIFTALGCDRDESEAKAAQVREHYFKLDKWKLYHDAIPSLALLKKNNWFSVLVTNNIPEFPLILKYLNLETFFDSVFVSALIGFNKPNPLILNGYLEAYRNHSKIIVVGDRAESDLEFAKALHVDGLLVHSTEKSQFRYFDNLTDLTKYLLSLNIE